MSILHSESYIFSFDHNHFFVAIICYHINDFSEYYR